MSGNSCSSALQTAPIVTAFWRGGRRVVLGRLGQLDVGVAGLGDWPSAAQEGELVLADLQLVAVGQPVRLDPLPVDVGAVERAAVVEVVVAAAARRAARGRARR